MIYSTRLGESVINASIHICRLLREHVQRMLALPITRLSDPLRRQNRSPQSNLLTPTLRTTSAQAC